MYTRHGGPDHRPCLRTATAADLLFCQALNRDNMARYLRARGIAWDPSRFLASWAQFENHVIVLDGRTVGLLRLLPEDDALGLRDLQVLPSDQGRGLGSWAMEQALAMAGARDFHRLQLRVYAENPARAWYARLGFEEVRIVHGTVHMARDLI